MNEIIVSGKQDFMGKEIPVISGGFGKDKKCMSDKTIAEIHGLETKHVRERINLNIRRFKENVDFIDLKQGVGLTDTLELLIQLGYSKSAITQAEHIYILSERGYAKLIKIMDTDLAWEVHDQIMDEYFQLKEKRDNEMSLDKLIHCSEIMAECPERNRPYVLNILRNIIPGVDEIPKDRRANNQVDTEELILQQPGALDKTMAKKKVSRVGYNIPFNYGKFDDYLLDNNIPNKELAEHLDCGTDLISAWRSGRYAPCGHYRKLFCEFFDLPVTYFNKRNRKTRK